MRNPETEAEPVESAFAQGFRAEIPPEASIDAGNLSSYRLDNKKPRRKNCSRKGAFASNK